MLISAATLAIAGCAEPDPLVQADELISRKRYSPAIVIYDQLIAENPESVAAWIGRGRAHAATGKTELALADFSAAIDIAPDQPEAFYRRSLVYERLGKQAEADADQASAHAVDPNYRWAFASMSSPSTSRMTDEEYEEEDETRLDQAELVAKNAEAQAQEARLDGEDAFAHRWVGVPEPLPPSSPNAAVHGDLASGGRRSDFAKFELLDEARNPGGLSFPWQTKSAYRTPIWLRPGTAAGTPKSGKTVAAKATAKAVTATSPFTTSPQPGPTNPFVRAPSPPPAASGAASQGNASAPANYGANRSTGSPFPQAPVPSTGRK